MSTFIKGIGSEAVDFVVGNARVKKMYLGKTLIYGKYDTKIKYLQSNGSQFINTGIKTSSSIRFIVYGKFNTSSAQDFGCIGNISGVVYRFHFGVYNSYFIFGVGSTYRDPYSYDTSRHTFELNGNGTAKLDSKSISLNSNLPEDLEITLFARNNADDELIDSFSNFTLYSSQIYDGNTLVRDFIPVRVGKTGYLYDKVSDKLFRNSGSGSFTLGQDI